MLSPAGDLFQDVNCFIAVLFFAGPTLAVGYNKVSKFQSQKRTFEEALSAGDLHFCLEKDGQNQVSPKKRLGEGDPKCEGPEHPPTITETVEDRADHLTQKVGTAHSEF